MRAQTFHLDELFEQAPEAIAVLTTDDRIVRVNKEFSRTFGYEASEVPPEYEDRIFDAFFTTRPQGTGMGLPIRRSIIESHSGRLWATRNPERGATFQFTLPSNSEPA